MSETINRRAPVSVDYIKSKLRVNTRTGKVYWIDPSIHHLPLVGKEAGYPCNSRGGKKYHVIGIDGVTYRRSYLIYTVKHGVWPHPFLDHINGDSLDDRASNLRIATRLQNSWNRKSGRPNKTLPMGVRKMGPRFQARIRKNNSMNYLGVFETVQDAHSAYLKARKEFFGEWA